MATSDTRSIKASSSGSVNTQVRPVEPSRAATSSDAHRLGKSQTLATGLGLAMLGVGRQGERPVGPSLIRSPLATLLIHAGGASRAAGGSRLRGRAGYNPLTMLAISSARRLDVARFAGT